MLDSSVLDLAVGLIFVYFAFSLLVSRLNEAVAGWRGWRASGLERGIRGLLEGGPDGASAVAGTPVTTVRLFGHNLVRNVSAGLGGRPPSYLPSRTFSRALLDLLTPSAGSLLDEITERADEAPALPAAARARLQAATDDPSPETLSALAGALHDLPETDRRRQAAEEAVAHASGDPLVQARLTVDHLPLGHPARGPLLRFVKDAGGDREKFRLGIEHWYDDAMARMGGWYKRRVQRFLLAYAVLLTVVFNVDSLTLAKSLWQDRTLRAAVVAAESRGAVTDGQSTADQVSAVRGLNLPIGWTAETRRLPDGRRVASTDPRHWPGGHPGALLLKLLGLALTVGALSFGAPFWFDLLGKVARVRQSGVRPAPADAVKPQRIVVQEPAAGRRRAPVG